MSAFDFKQLDVYKVTIEFMATAEAIIERLPPGHGKLIDQLRRAGTSIALNIAEGAGEAQGDEKKRIYRIARRSAFECAAAFDVMRGGDSAMRLSSGTLIAFSSASAPRSHA